ncbi:hypothetical protein [Heyndrickxia coagulans]|uniref:Uncharacterized protein n=1 Tax=Heyndrickxia coagulans TaxID=1398 RepID=A0AAW7CLL8_HEYCO|nr:hypothetical protein [Heyndrickxia coagulans]MDL5041992.1 hypothetical protein [Heyndrickxia coagulans]
MKYKVIFKKSNTGLTVQVPNEISPVAILLMGDVQSNSRPWLDLLYRVLNDESIYEECTGNNCTLEIKKDFTNITDNYSDEDDECIIETKELVKIIELWTTKINSINK